MCSVDVYDSSYICACLPPAILCDYHPPLIIIVKETQLYILYILYAGGYPELIFLGGKLQYCSACLPPKTYPCIVLMYVQCYNLKE
jgi:hypothetical protein